MKHKHTKEEALAIAKKYNAIKDLINENQSCYYRIRKENWSEECFAHMDSYKTLKRGSIENIVRDALKYESLKEWRNSKSPFYKRMTNKRWNDQVKGKVLQINNQFIWQKRVSYTSDMARLEAKKFNTLVDLMKYNQGCYVAIRKNGWQKECFAHLMVKKRTWDSNDQIFSEAKKYKSYKEWYRTSSYSAAQIRGLIGAVKKAMGWENECRYDNFYRRMKWKSSDAIIHNALTYNSYTEWRRSPSYAAAKKRKLLNEIKERMATRL